MKVGLKQISEVSGYSVTTVSNVLNQKPGINASTAEKVIKVAENLGYFGKNKIKSVKFVMYRKHGSVVAETPFFSELIEGVEAECRARNMPLEIVNLISTDEDFDLTLARLLQDHDSGILLLATELEEEDIIPFADALGPVALLDSWFSSMRFSATCISNKDAVLSAVNHLVEKGHRRIGYLKSAVPINNFRFRSEGFEMGLRRKNLTFDPALVTELSPSMEGAYQDMCRFLQTEPVLASAYFADNDIIALGAMKALQEFGIKVPEDVSIIGFDDISYCEIATPTLTTIRVHKRTLGSTGVKTLLDTYENNNVEAKLKVQVCTTLVERDSVRELTT